MIPYKQFSVSLSINLMIINFVLLGACSERPAANDDNKSQTTGRIATDSVETWRDMASGLIWQTAPDGWKMGWDFAKSYCSNLSLGGYSDWRLPDIKELRTLVRGCNATEPSGACGVTTDCLNQGCYRSECKGCKFNHGPTDGIYWPAGLQGKRGWFWSSSFIEGHANVGWAIGFDDGGVYRTFKETACYVRCVREETRKQ